MVAGAYSAAATMVDRIDSLRGEPIFHWGCPVPFFGSLESATVATVGINPSNREFVDFEGNELTGTRRRLPTLASLGLTRWAEADALHLQSMLDGCSSYFDRNPYGQWFNVLDRVLSGLEVSYYGPVPAACHLDIVPYSTTEKWGTLSGEQRHKLWTVSRDTLALFLQVSRVRLLILNGSSVSSLFEVLSGRTLSRVTMASWGLPRVGGASVRGVAYSGVIDALGGLDLGRRVFVVGYNHNLQSSYGVTGGVINRIGRWVAQVSREVVP